MAQTSKRRVRTRQSLEDGATTTTTPSTTAAAAALGAPSPTKRQRRTSLRSQIGHSPVHLPPPPPPPSPPVPTPAAVAAAVTPPQQSTAASRSRLARSPTNLERRFTATSSALAASPVRTTAAQRTGRLTAAQRAAQTTAAQRAAQIAAAQRAERTLQAKALLQRTRFNVGGGRAGSQAAAPARRRRGNAALTAAIGAASTPAIGGRAGHKRALTPAERQVAAARNVPANDAPRDWAARSSLAPNSSRSSGGAAGAGVGAQPRSSASQTVRVIPEKQEAMAAKAKQLMGRHHAGRPLPHHLERLEQVMKAVDLALVSRAQTVPQPVTVIAQSVARTV